jgi:predicted nucleotidyltransferase
MLTDADVTRIAQRIADTVDPVAVATFGSYATGTAHDQSDLDLLVIYQDLLVIYQRANRAPLRAAAVRRLLPSVLWPLDIHVFTPQEFESRALEYLSFELIIARQAKCYYRREDAPRLVPVLFQNDRA